MTISIIKERPIHSFLLIIPIVLTVFMISNNSLWIDEAQTATYAKLENFTQFKEKIASDNQTGTLSEGLMPLSMFLAWLVANLIGHGEIALRIPNILYLTIGFSYLWRIGYVCKIHHLTLFFALQPFVWYYAGEARPYSFQIAVGSALLWYMLQIIRSEGKSISGCVGFLSTGLLLCGSSLLSVIPAAVSGAVLALIFLKNRWKFRANHLIAMAVFSPIYLALGFFYFEAIQNFNSSEKLWPFSIANVALAFYELLGFQGLGPSRVALREGVRSGQSLLSIFSAFVVPMGLLAFGWLLILYCALRNFKKNIYSSFFPLFLVVVISIFFFVLAGLIMKFPFWGRHLAPIAPFVTTLALIAINNSTLSNHMRKLVIISIGLLCSYSSVNIRFSPNHRNDDYRGVATFVRDKFNSGATVWWSADLKSAEYYGLEIVSIKQRTQSKDDTAIFQVMNDTTEDLHKLPKADWIVVSKPDIYDNKSKLDQFLKENNYSETTSFRSFIVWHK
jgi:hypothetical protein